MGLSRKHHSELNSVNVSKARLRELRSRYKNDRVALQQIDVYNGSTEYYNKLKQYREALKSGNDRRAAELGRWFDENYPDI